MTVILLIRHAHCASVGNWLAGRTPAIHLDELGQSQARELATRFAGVSLDAVVSSPRERTQETADAIARCTGSAVEIDPALDEVDFGDWTGRRFDELAEDAAWKEWNSRRSVARAPNGEAMGEVQSRALGMMRAVARRFPQGRVALVSHADVIRAAVAGILEIPLERCIQLVVPPASVTTIRLWPDWAEVVATGWVGEFPTK